jgi:hypothetical protein
MKASKTIIAFVFFMLAFFSCRERYEAEILSGQNNLLVVEGLINPSGITTIQLSRTLPLTNAKNIQPEPHASVIIKGSDGSEYPLQEAPNGVYNSADNQLDTSVAYQVRIRTANGSEYQSELVPVKYNPPIDSVYWQIKGDGVQIYVDTHDPKNGTRYYKWDYSETWEFHSSYPYKFRYVNDPIPTVVPRDPSEIDPLFICWKTLPSSNIFLGTSAHLTNDVISKAPVTFIPFDSEKTGIRYSILVRQYALDRKGYDFYTLMRTNTESIGSIFDPQPTETVGNITCVTNPAEKVVGYIGATEVKEQRIFISSLEIPSTFVFLCETSYVDNHPDSLRKYLGSSMFAPYEMVGDPRNIKGYDISLTGCLDCTLRGSSIKPSFW